MQIGQRQIAIVAMLLITVVLPEFVHAQTVAESGAGEREVATAGVGENDRGSLLDLASHQFIDLTRAERAVLVYHDVKNVGRVGDWAVCGTSAGADDPSNNPQNAAQWTRDREVRAQLVRWMSVDPDALRRIDPGGLRIIGARITGALDLKDARLTFPLILRNCAIPERMNLKAATFPRLDLNGSYTGEIEGRGLTVNNDLDIGRNFHAAGEVSLWASTIGGDLDASGGHFMHSKVEPQPIGAQWKMALIATSAHITGNIWLCCGFESNGDVFLSRMKLGGELYAFAGRFFNPNNTALDASRSEIDGDVWFASFPPTLSGPVIDGLIDFNGAAFSGGATLVFNGARFEAAEGDANGLYMFSTTIPGFVWVNNTLGKDTLLNVRDSQVQEFYDDERSWPQPGHLLIDGFTYGDLGGSGRAFAAPPIDAPSRLKWLALQPTFHSQPYKQLAKVLAARGDSAGADRVLIAMEDGRYASAGIGERILGAALKGTIGYGYRPLLAVFWCFAVIVVGWPIIAIAKRAGVMRQTWPENSPKPAEDSYEPLHPFLYSLDVFLPFVNLHQEHYWWPDARARGTATVGGYSIPWRGSFMRYFLWYQIVAGWVLSAILLAGVTGLIRHD